MRVNQSGRFTSSEFPRMDTTFVLSGFEFQSEFSFSDEPSTEFVLIEGVGEGEGEGAFFGIALALPEHCLSIA